MHWLDRTLGRAFTLLPLLQHPKTPVRLLFQSKNNRHIDDQDELNDIQIRLPPLRSSRSSLNAVDNVNNKSNNTLTVTQAVVSMPTPSTTPETDSSSKTTQSTSTGAVSPVSHHPGTNVVRISTL